MGSIHPNFIVGIGGSAGALNAYKAFVGVLPSDTGMAFVIVSHIHPTAHSYLSQILSRQTKMPVMLASDAMPIWANHVYLTPADSDLTVVGNVFKVVSPRTSRGNQIDLFFVSLAEAIGARAIGIIFSGYQSDGTEGCKQIKEKGGITFAQDKSAEIDSMPRRAEAAGCIDFVLSPEKIVDELQRLALLRK